MRFVDTNIPLYAVSSRQEDTRKQRISEDILSQESGNLAISVQVLGEFYAQVTRPSRPDPMGHREALTFVDRLQRYYVQPLTLETFSKAMQYRERFCLNYWDCLLLAAAKLGGCDAVYSEDMNANQDYDGIGVINPFEAVSEPVRV